MMNKTAVTKPIKRNILGHFILCGLLGLSGRMQATTPAPQKNHTLTSHHHTLQTAPHDVQPITQEVYLNSEDEHKITEAAPLPLDQLLIPANGQCLYTTIVMGYLLPVREEADEVTTRIDQLFGMQPAGYINELYQTLENPTYYLTYLHSDAFSSLVSAFMTRMQIKKGTWGGPQEIQTISTKLKVNIQEYYPDPNNRTTLLQSDLTKPAKAATTTLHIVRDRVHPAEVLTQAEKDSAVDGLHYQHYRLKYTLPSPLSAPVLPNTQPSTPPVQKLRLTEAAMAYSPTNSPTYKQEKKIQWDRSLRNIPSQMCDRNAFVCHYFSKDVNSERFSTWREEVLEIVVKYEKYELEKYLDDWLVNIRRIEDIKAIEYTLEKHKMRNFQKINEIKANLRDMRALLIKRMSPPSIFISVYPAIAVVDELYYIGMREIALEVSKKELGERHKITQYLSSSSLDVVWDFMSNLSSIFTTELVSDESSDSLSTKKGQ